jgi:hypothetical protein
VIRSQVLVQGFAADAEVTGQLAFCSPPRHAVSVRQSVHRQRFLAAPVGSALLGQRDASRCRSRIKARSNSAKAPMTDSIRFAIGESSPVKVRLLDELDAHAALGQLLYEAAQVIEVARQRSMLCTTTVSPSRTKASSVPARAAGCPCPTPCR